MINNLLPRVLDKSEIKTCTESLCDFKFSITEGGYISPDYTVILINFRDPYQGQLLQYMPDTDHEKTNNWVRKICDIVGIKNGLRTFEMVALADENGKRYQNGCVTYQKDSGFCGVMGEEWEAKAFSFEGGLNYFIHKEGWLESSGSDF